MSSIETNQSFENFTQDTAPAAVPEVESVPVFNPPVPDIVVSEPTGNTPLAGIYSRAAPMATDQEQCLKTYTSIGRNIIAALPVKKGMRPLTVSFSPFIQKSSFVDALLGENLPGNIDVTHLFPSPEVIQWRVGTNSVNMTGIVIGCNKGLVRTARAVGHILEFPQHTSIGVLNGPDWGNQKLVIAPVYAPMFGTITDEAVLKAERNLSYAFLSVPASSRPPARIGSVANYLYQQGVNSVRFMMRLASLYVCLSFGTCRMDDIACTLETVHGPPGRLDASDWTVWHSALRDHSNASNYIPWNPPNLEPSPEDLQFYVMLYFVATSSISLRFSDGRSQRPHLWPQIPNTCMLGNMPVMFVDTLRVSASAVYEAAIVWCTRYGDVNIFKECLDFASTMYWSMDGRNCALGYNDCDILLPPAHMRGFLLAPILQDMERLKPLVLADYNVDVAKMMYESALKAYLIAYARVYQQTALLDAPVEQGLFADHFDMRQALTILIRPAPDVGAPIWHTVQNTLLKFGVKGAFGRIFSTISWTTNVNVYQNHVAATASRVVNGFDMLGILPSIPVDTSVAGWIKPFCFPEQLDINEVYLYGDLAKYGDIETSLSAISNSKYVEGYMVITGRERHSVRTVDSNFHHFDSRGFRRDFVNFKFDLPDGSQVRHAFRVKSLRGVIELSSPESDRRKLDWYYTTAVTAGWTTVKALPGTLHDPPNPAFLTSRGTANQRQVADSLRTRTSRVLRQLRIPPCSDSAPSSRRDDSDSSDADDHTDARSARTHGGEMRAPQNTQTPIVVTSVESERPQAPTAEQVVAAILLEQKRSKQLVIASQVAKESHSTNFRNPHVAMLAPLLSRAEKCVWVKLDEVQGGSIYDAFLSSFAKFWLPLHEVRMGERVDEDSAVITCAYVMDLFNVQLMLDIQAGSRITFLEVFKQLLVIGMSELNTTRVNSDHWSRHGIRVMKFIDNLDTLIAHLRFNPELLPHKLVTDHTSHMSAAMQEKCLADELTSEEVLRYIMYNRDFASSSTTELSPPRPEVLGVLCVLLMQQADKLLTSPPATSVLTHLTAKFGMEIQLLSAEEREKLVEHCANIQAALDEARGGAETADSLRSGFRKRDSDEDDDEEPSSAAGPSSGTASSSTATGYVRLEKIKARLANKNKGGNSRSGGGKRNSTPCYPLVPMDGCTFQVQAMNKKARILFYLMRGCACSLVKYFGGKWDQHPHVSDNFKCMVENFTAVNARKWFDSLTIKFRAEYMLFCHPGAAGVEHFREVYDENIAVEHGLDLARYHERIEVFKRISAGVDIDLTGYSWVPLWITLFKQLYPAELMQRLSDFEPIKLQGGMPVVMTVGILLSIYPALSPVVELVHNLSPTSLEYEVATMLFAMMQLPPELIFELLMQDWFSVPLENWHKTFAEVMVRTKRSGIFGRVVNEKVFAIRKFLNTTIRRKGEPDMNVECRNRALHTTHKVWFGWTAEDWVEQGSPRQFYINRFAHHAGMHWRKVIASITARERPRTVQQFWDERALHTPAGASTLIKTIDTTQIDTRIAPGDRLNKKVTVELLPDNFLSNIMQMRPSNRATFFVKPEPGKKLRALYSSFDEEAFISAYASQYQENHMHVIDGVMVRQTPHDVLAWMAESENKLGTVSSDACYWQSTDYSDYNAEHTMQEQAIIDATAAVVWEEMGKPINDEAMLQKAKACRWKAMSYYNSWVCWGQRDVGDWQTKICDHDPHKLYAVNGNYISELFTVDQYNARKTKKFRVWTRVYNGLYSGHRDTARNNTMIHACDVAIAKEQLEEFDFPWNTQFTAICGDDEDIKFGDSLTAAIYYATLAPVGHALNPRKQMAGHEHHEFLQLQAAANTRMEKPLNALLSTLGTGNWYTQLGLWVQTAIESCINNWWEAYARGVQKGIARQACAAYLDQLMYLPPAHCEGTEYAETGKKLEWWAFRVQDNLPPLFELEPGEERKRMPKFESVPDVLASWPNNASVRYVRNQKKIMSYLPKDYTKEFEEACQLDTVGTVLKTWRQKDAKRWAARFWPERSAVECEHIYKDYSKNIEQPADMGMFKINTPHRKRVLSESTVYSRMGVSMFIGRKLGGINNMGKFLPLAQWAHATNIESESYALNAQGHELQTNLKACLSYQKVPTARYHSHAVQTASQKFNYVFMANASGKTRACRTLGLADDLDEVWTDLYGAFRGDYKLSMPASSFSKVATATSEIIRTSMKSKGALLGQLQPVAIKKAIDDLRIEAECYYFDPGEEIRRVRMQRRGWSEEKIARRSERAREFYAEAVELGWKELKSPEQLEAMLQEAMQERRTPLLTNLVDVPKQRMEYVFDRTELVTRQLKIQEETTQERNSSANAT